jgi:hypothetical protein
MGETIVTSAEWDANIRQKTRKPECLLWIQRDPFLRLWSFWRVDMEPSNIESAPRQRWPAPTAGSSQTAMLRVRSPGGSG